MKRVIILLSVIIFFSCSNSNSEIETENFPTTLEIIEIGKGSLTGSGLENVPFTKEVIKNNNDWKELLSKMDKIENVSNHFNATNLNFETNTIIALITEEKDRGWEILVNEIIEYSDKIIVKYIEKDYFTLQNTQPFHIVSIPNTDKEILFEK